MFRIWDRLYYESIPYGRKGIAMMALSGVDLALWDALGKAETARWQTQSAAFANHWRGLRKLIRGIERSGQNATIGTGPDRCGGIGQGGSRDYNGS